MVSYGFDKVTLQPIMVPHWERGNTEGGEYRGGGNTGGEGNVWGGANTGTGGIQGEREYRGRGNTG